MKPTVLFLCRIADEDARHRIAQVADIVELEATAAAEIVAQLAGKQGLIVPFTEQMIVTREVLDAGKDLRLVGATYGGVRQNIDAEAVLERGLTLIHTGESRVRPMAEYTLALVLSSLLHIHNYHHDMRSGEAWPRFKYPRSRILQGRKVGVVGLGRIGRGIVELFKVLTGDISVFSRHLSDAEAVRMGVTQLGLDEIFAECEIIILAGGHTPETHHMVGERQFAAMRDKALFVNIARGKMVDQDAMIAAVQTRDIHLALDVFENEPLEADSPLRENDCVLLTPHRANNSIEFEQRWQCLADEIERFFKGETPDSALTPERAASMSES